MKVQNEKKFSNPKGRCYKGYFRDCRSALLGLGRCHGLSKDRKVNGVVWKPCSYLTKCLGMSVKEWKRRNSVNQIDAR